MDVNRYIIISKPGNAYSLGNCLCCGVIFYIHIIFTQKWIEKNGKRILNPHSSVVFDWNDIVWIVGDRNKIQKMTEPSVT